MKHKYMPVSISMSNRSSLVVGGGAVAVRKVESLLDYDTHVTVVAPQVQEKLEYFADRGMIRLEKREYRSPEAADYGFVISATGDTALNRQVYEDATGSGVLVNVVDDPPHCDAIFPAVLRRDCLTVAISTDGRAPFVAGHLRVVLDNIFPEHWERLMKLAADFRGRVRERWADQSLKKNACYAEFLEADWKRMLKEMSDEEIEEELVRMLEMPQ
uniref:precorrin-2 dehydrogenase n=1 Tax=uncultured sulfate-reducing bacterium TaxID=153939 RepID=Q3IBM7_9BACT|nr:Siroheme synthase [uncultured sulfate-reducing bacterium]